MECQGVLISLEQKGFTIIPPKDLSQEQIIIKFLEAFQDNGILARNILRDILIRKQYVEFKQEGMSSKDARSKIEETAQQDSKGNVYYLSEDTIKNILYSEKKRH